MNWLMESPWPSLMLGAAVEALLAIWFFRSGSARVLAAIMIVLALTAGMLVLERVVVTPSEHVEDALDAVAAALVANDARRVVDSFAPQSPRRREIEAAMSHVTIRAAKVGGDLEIRLDEQASPPLAITSFIGRIEARDHRGAIPYENFVGRFRVTLQRHEGRWLIYDYAQTDLRDSVSRTKSPGGTP